MSVRELTFDDTVAIVLVLVLFSAACVMPFQSDTWWHLRTGLEMWSHHSVMLTDAFSYTAYGRYWPNHEWLGDALIFGAYRVAGLPGMAALAAVCVTAATAMSWQLMQGRAITKLLLLALATPSLVMVWTVRPLVFTLLLLMVVLRLVLRQRYWLVPIVFVVWSNLHGGVALGLVVLAGVAAADVWMCGRRCVPRWILLIAASTGATLLTPLGVHLWTTIPESVHKSVANGILEWRPAAFDWRDAAFWVVAAAWLAATIAACRSIVTRNHAALVAVSILLLPLAVRYSRNITPFVLVAVPALSMSLAAMRPTFSRPAVRPTGGRVNALVVVTVAAICVVSVAGAWRSHAERLGWQPVSSRVVDAVESCTGPLYNRFDDGGYLIWFAPGVRVFVDNRQDPYPLDFLQEHRKNEISGEYESTFRRYGIRCAFLPPTSPTARRLAAAGWTVTASDEHWMVFAAPSVFLAKPRAGSSR